MDQGLLLDEASEEKIQQYLLMSQRMQFKDLQTGHRLIGKKKQKTSLLGTPGLYLQSLGLLSIVFILQITL